MNRREAREKAVQTLFQLDNIDMTVEEAMSFIVEGKPHPFYNQLVQGTMTNRDEIDAVLKEHLKNWELNRLPKIERTILRLALYELKFNQEEVPTRVVINEAIELSKTFSDEKSGRFVNGVLSKITNNN